MDEKRMKGFFKTTKGLLMKKYRKSRYRTNEKLTIMVVPHNQKGVRNLNVPHWTIVAAALVLLAMVSFSVVTISKYVYLSWKQEKYASQNEEMIKELERLIYNSDDLIHVQKNFSVSLNSLLKTAGLSDEVFFNETGMGGPLVENKNTSGITGDVNVESNYQDYLFSQVEEIKDLAKMEKEIGVINEKIQKLSRKLRYFEKVTRYIPSIWPILGDGKIVSSDDSTMVISTLPFTPVVATANGKISKISFDNNQIKINLSHKYQFISVYSNLYVLEDGVEEGKVVGKGDILGYVAKTSGKSFFEYSLYIGNQNGIYPLNPLKFSHLGR